VGAPAEAGDWIERKARKRTPFAFQGARFLAFLSIHPALRAGPPVAQLRVLGSSAISA